MKNTATLRIEKMVKEQCPKGRWYVFLAQKEIKFLGAVDAYSKPDEELKCCEFSKMNAMFADYNVNFDNLTIKDGAIAIYKLRFIKNIKEKYGITAEFAGPNIYLRY